jgi:pimeloyl-ACP methyl ester carboxylesterase
MLTRTLLIIFISFILYRAFEKEDISHIKELPYEITGNLNSNTLLIFLHGFPNTSSMWSKLKNELDSKYLCMTISYPNYSDKLKLRWGLEIDKIIELIKATIDGYEKANGKNYDKIIVSHDWGAFFTYLFEDRYPNYLKEMLTIDVGVGIGSIKDRILILSYNFYLASAFFIGGPIGNSMVKLFYDYFVKDQEYGMRPDEVERVDSSWTYLYFNNLKNILNVRKFQVEYQRKTPIVYLYGENKLFNFHDDKFINDIKNDSKSEVIPFPTGHWVMNGNEAKIANIIKRRNP